MKGISEKPAVLVLYNQVGEDEYDKIKTVDPKTLNFDPKYDIHVATANEEYMAIADALRKEGHEVAVVNLKENSETMYRLLQKNPPDVVFNLVEFFHDSHLLEPAVAAFFDLYNVAYTGCSSFSLNVCLHKGLAKQVLLANGIPTPKFLSLNEMKLPKRLRLKYPLIVKPACEDASSGIEKESVVYTHRELVLRLEKMFTEFPPPLLIEEYIEGREFHVSILGNDPPKVLPVIEFDFSKFLKHHPKIITYDAKWNPLTEEFHRIRTSCPAKLSRAELKKIEHIALAAYTVLGCRDYARVDLRIGKQNRIFVLEVNPNPDLTEGVSFMESAEKAGLTFSETLSTLVEFACARKIKEWQHTLHLNEEMKKTKPES